MTTYEDEPQEDVERAYREGRPVVTESPSRTSAEQHSRTLTEAGNRNSAPLWLVLCEGIEVGRFDSAVDARGMAASWNSAYPAPDHAEFIVVAPGDKGHPFTCTECWENDCCYGVGCDDDALPHACWSCLS